MFLFCIKKDMLTAYVLKDMLTAKPNNTKNTHFKTSNKVTRLLLDGEVWTESK